MAKQNIIRKFMKILATSLLLLMPLFGLGSPEPAYPNTEQSPTTITAFSKWELAYNENDFTLRATSLNNHAIILQFANSFGQSIAEIPQTFVISLELADKDLFKFDEGDYETCEIFIDGIGYQAHAARTNFSISIRDKSLANALLDSTHDQFVISFPELTISYTFPLEGFKAAFNRVKSLQLEIELKKRAKAIQIFSYLGSIAILVVSCAGIGFFIYTRYQAKALNPQKENKQDKANSERKAKSASNAKKDSQQTSGKSEKAKSKRHAKYSQSGFNTGYSFNGHTNDNFYERANFGNPFSSSSSNSIPLEVRNAFEFFNLPTSASFAEIREKRTFLLKAYHPDRFQGDETAMKTAEEQTKKVNYNFDVLAKYYT